MMVFHAKSSGALIELVCGSKAKRGLIITEWIYSKIFLRIFWRYYG
jgi:hypothetical protein